MKLFIKRVLVFICPLVVLLLLCELFLRGMETSYKIKKEQLVASAGAVEVLILGNSHENYGVDPRQFSPYAFNLAQVGQPLYFDKRITLNYIDRLKKLKYVLIGVDFHSLYFSDEGIRDLWSYYGYGVDCKDTLPVLWKCSYLAGYKVGLTSEFMKRALDKKYRVVKALDVESGVNYNEPFVKGFVPLKNDTDLRDEHSKLRAEYFNSLVHQSQERADVLSDLADFISSLKHRNITPILLTMPCYGPYRELLDPWVRERNKIDMQGISDKFHIPWWNYFEWPLSADCFANCDHLNGRGAAIFSGMLNRRIGALNKRGE
jgi:hypothetical protein